jgi:polyhydroxyalkanoate synthase subunit PhaC
MAAEDMTYGAEVAGLDVAELGQSLGSAMASLLRHPEHMMRATAKLWLAEAEIAANAFRLAALGAQVELPEKDRRFADPAWQGNPWLYLTAASYQEMSRSAREALRAAPLAEMTAAKAEFGTGMLLDALCPANVPWLNPRVVKEVYDTGGRSAILGLTQFAEDVLHNNGRPRQVDRDAFELGKDLAATPGRVVLRNELMELIAYDPQTPTVHAEPILCSPPWINKYYIMDLAPQRSFIEYMVQHGFTVFAISYRNPDASMAELSMDDYLSDGLLTAVDAVYDLTGAKRVNLVALCLGGLLSTIGLAYLAATDQADRVGWTTLTNTLIDYADPGDLRIFTDEKRIRQLERKMARQGYLDASSMASTFDWMRGNDLVWSYVVENWYMGRKPPAFDILAWNADSTHMPARMHSQYLRSFYLRNLLVTPGAYQVRGVPLDLGKVENPLYVLAAEADHIAPWRASYRTTQLVGGPVRFVLSNSGHIAGIVNPPGNAKAAHWVADDLPDGAARWRAQAQRRPGTWWEDWLAWAEARSGDMIKPPVLPDGAPAPGSYVRDTAQPRRG